MIQLCFESDFLRNESALSGNFQLYHGEFCNIIFKK